MTRSKCSHAVFHEVSGAPLQHSSPLNFRESFWEFSFLTDLTNMFSFSEKPSGTEMMDKEGEGR